MIDNSHDDGKSDETAGDSALTNSSHKQSPRSSPGHINTNLTNENLSSNDNVGVHDDNNDSGIPSTHLMINSLPTASMPIPSQRLPTSNQQQQQQQMLLYQQQQQQQQQA